MVHARSDACEIELQPSYISYIYENHIVFMLV